MSSEVSEGDEEKFGDDGVALCASCDRCRARKTRCDGKRPCGNCLAKYMKKHKVTSVEGVPPENLECMYSPAKRRGPIPGRTQSAAEKSTTTGSTRKANEMLSVHSEDSKDVDNSLQQRNNMFGSQNTTQADWITGIGQIGTGGLIDPQIVALLEAQQNKGNSDSAVLTTNIQQQISLIQQQLQQQHLQQQNRKGENQDSMNGGTSDDQRNSRRMKIEDDTATRGSVAEHVPRTIMSHTHLLDRSDPEGSRLRAYYKLSIDELFCLPPTPSDEEYCARLNIAGLTPSMIPGTHLAALSAARFAEASLGAIVHNEVNLAMELCNAVVHCLREVVQETVQAPVIYEVAKSYFLLGIFRAFRGDMPRYFKYRRVCLTYLAKLESNADTQVLLASMSYLDAWAYMIYNANEKAIPDVDDTIPMPLQNGGTVVGGNETEQKYNIRTDINSISCDPRNKNWIQGAPVVYLNNEAPLGSRVIDALACAVRTCCDQANQRFAAIASAVEEPDNQPNLIPPENIITPTTTAVLAHENELCSRNLILSAFALLQHHDNGKGHAKNIGQLMVLSAMDAFLENNDESGNSGLSDSQIQSFLSVCNTVIENPQLLHHAGPTYHMVTNAAVLLCHFLNGMHAMTSTNQFGAMEEALFEEVVDTLIAVRKVLTIHRRKLPVVLRCHGLPRPNLKATPGQPYVDLGETLLCVCRGCQGFVLMACSPCVAAERARTAASRIELAAAQEAEAFEMGDFGADFHDLGSEFNVDDDALLGMISNLISG